jgi:hypothetical protein
MLNSTHLLVLLCKLLFLLLSSLLGLFLHILALLFKQPLLDLILRHHFFLINFDDKLVRRDFFEHAFLIVQVYNLRKINCRGKLLGLLDFSHHEIFAAFFLSLLKNFFLILSFAVSVFIFWLSRIFHFVFTKCLLLILDSFGVDKVKKELKFFEMAIFNHAICFIETQDINHWKLSI